MNGGELSVHFTNSVLVTVLVALFVLWRYRQAILGGMMLGDGAVPLGRGHVPRQRPHGPAK